MLLVSQRVKDSNFFDCFAGFVLTVTHTNEDDVVFVGQASHHGKAFTQFSELFPSHTSMTRFDTGVFADSQDLP